MNFFMHVHDVSNCDMNMDGALPKEECEALPEKKMASQPPNNKVRTALVWACTATLLACVFQSPHTENFFALYECVAMGLIASTSFAVSWMNEGLLQKMSTNVKTNPVNTEEKKNKAF